QTQGVPACRREHPNREDQVMDVERHCQQIDELLPWYVNRSLPGREAEIVLEHLDGCERCRDEAEWLAQVGSQLRNSRMQTVNEAEAPLLELGRRIAEDAAAGRSAQQYRNHYAIAAGLLLALATVAGVVMSWQPFEPRFRTVTDTVAPARATVTMAFELKADAPLSSLYGVLEKYDAEIVDGPDTAGRIVLEFRLD